MDESNTPLKPVISLQEYGVISAQASTLYVGMLNRYPNNMLAMAVSGDLMKQAVDVAVLMNDYLKDKCTVETDLSSLDDKQLKVLIESGTLTNQQINTLKVQKYLQKQGKK